MKKFYYKAYWMVTNRCNLSCKYCVLEDSPDQLRAELDLKGKKELVSHLYQKLGFRRLTLSGGEVLIFGKHPPSEFIELLRHIRTFRSKDNNENLEIELYTNGTYLDKNVANEMKGVVDLVAVTIDSTNDNFLTEIGRNNGRYQKYYEQILRTCSLLADVGIKIKLHSVIGQKNHLSLPHEVGNILDAVEKVSGNLSCWKFYQYMSYDAPEKDIMHAINSDQYQHFTEQVKQTLRGRNLKVHFKDNQEMNASLFNILSYGNAQYMRDNDTWSTSQRTSDLRNYQSMEDLLSTHDINVERFKKFHEIAR